VLSVEQLEPRGESRHPDRPGHAALLVMDLKHGVSGVAASGGDIRFQAPGIPNYPAAMCIDLPISAWYGGTQGGT
jgi:hypothetical protein